MSRPDLLDEIIVKVESGQSIDVEETAFLTDWAFRHPETAARIAEVLENSLEGIMAKSVSDIDLSEDFGDSE